MSRDIILDENSDYYENEAPQNAQEYPPPAMVLVRTAVNIDNWFELWEIGEND